jgi:ABC-type bacteriocin/lantibiotic exporter with double-glycine peptidase domain
MAWFPYGVLLAAVAVAALVVLGLVLLSLWRKTKRLMSTVATASETISASTEALEQLHSASPRSPAGRHR